MVAIVGFPISFDHIGFETPNEIFKWIWNGYLAKGQITLFTSRWKLGKSTLLTGLLSKMGEPGEFLDIPVSAAKVLVFSEENRDTWALRTTVIPVGPHARLWPRPFRGHPTLSDWQLLVQDATDAQRRGELDLLVVDSLSTFLPGYTENDAATMREFLLPLRELAEAGAAILLTHHPRKHKSVPGSSPRGTGFLSGFVDIALEMNTCGMAPEDLFRRRIRAFSRFTETPEKLVFEWIHNTPVFKRIPDLEIHRLNERWDEIENALQGRYLANISLSATDIRSRWSTTKRRPPISMLTSWLNLAMQQNRICRYGVGTRGKPFRYYLPLDHEPKTNPKTVF